MIIRQNDIPQHFNRRIPTGNSEHSLLNGSYCLTTKFFLQGTLIPGNECTCGEHCLPYGAVYATACKENTPNYLTLPHFYKADPSFADKFVGIKPDPEKHDFHIIYEPVSI